MSAPSMHARRPERLAKPDAGRCRRQTRSEPLTPDRKTRHARPEVRQGIHRRRQPHRGLRLGLAEARLQQATEARNEEERNGLRRERAGLVAAPRSLDVDLLLREQSLFDAVLLDVDNGPVASAITASRSRPITCVRG